MTGSFIFAYFIMPFIVGGLGLTAAYLHVRADKAELRAQAVSNRAEG